MRAAMLVVAIAFVLSPLTSAGGARAEEVAEVASRPGQRVRTLLLRPATPPAGTVILLAGGHGNLSIGRNGAIGWGRLNQLVRTRAAYARAGFVVLVPDIAPDLKNGSSGVDGYRWSEAHARDIGALVRYARGLAPPVHLVGTSRAALSVTNAAVRLAGEERPDSLVVTSGMLMHVASDQPSAERTVGRLGRISQPTLLMFHRRDGCEYTPAGTAEPFRRLLTGAQKVDIRLLDGGSAGRGDPCEAQSHHGFLGQDQEVVDAISAWLKGLAR